MRIVCPIEIPAILKSDGRLLAKYRRQIQCRNSIRAEMLCQHAQCLDFLRSVDRRIRQKRVVDIEFIWNHENQQFVAGCSHGGLEPDKKIRVCGAYFVETGNLKSKKTHLLPVAEPFP